MAARPGTQGHGRAGALPFVLVVREMAVTDRHESRAGWVRGGALLPVAHVAAGDSGVGCSGSSEDGEGLRADH